MVRWKDILFLVHCCHAPVIKYKVQEGSNFKGSFWKGELWVIIHTVTKFLFLSKPMWSEMWWGCSLFIYLLTCHGILKAFLSHKMIDLEQLTAKFWLSVCIALAPRDTSWDQDRLCVHGYSDRQGLSDELMIYLQEYLLILLLKMRKQLTWCYTESHHDR